LSTALLDFLRKSLPPTATTHNVAVLSMITNAQTVMFVHQKTISDQKTGDVIRAENMGPDLQNILR